LIAAGHQLARRSSHPRSSSNDGFAIHGTDESLIRRHPAHAAASIAGRVRGPRSPRSKITDRLLTAR